MGYLLLCCRCLEDFAANPVGCAERKVGIFLKAVERKRKDPGEARPGSHSNPHNIDEEEDRGDDEMAAAKQEFTEGSG